MSFRVLFDGPDDYSPLETFFAEGSNPRFLRSLISYIDENRKQIQSIYGALYLYNNKLLHEYLVELAKEGITVNIVSIPLDGYDDTEARTAINSVDGEKRYDYPQSKFTLANEIYSQILENPIENFNFYIFPHMYTRSRNVRPFARGTLPYSLHIKSMYFEKEGNSSALMLTSSNMAVRDQTKDEAMIIIDGRENGPMASYQFFQDLISQSIDIRDFDEKADYHSYQIDILPIIDNKYNLFTAPFYENSNDKLEEFLIGKINGATERVYVMGQHLAAYNYDFEKSQKYKNAKGRERRRGLLGAVIDKANEGLDVRCLSQTYIDENGNEIEGANAPANRSAFKQFVRAYNRSGNGHYAVNRKVHAKFIIIDNSVAITTCNWTPTQFLYLGNVEIAEFVRIPGVSYTGIHAEVGQLLFIPNKAVTERFLNYFESLWRNERTTVIS